MLETNSALWNLSILTFSLSSFSLLFFYYHHIFRSQTHNKTKTTNPCPQSYPIVGNLMGFLRNRNRFHDWVAEMLADTPSLTLQVNGFLGLSRGVCTANPANVEQLLRSNFPNYVKGRRFRSVLEELLGGGIFNADGRLWSGQRKIASHEFNTRSLKHFISHTVQSHLSHRLVPLLSQACDAKETVHLQEVFRRFAFDNICNVAFGIDPGWLGTNSQKTVKNSANSSFVRAFDYAVEVSSDRFLSPVPALWKIKRFLNIGCEKKYKEAIAVINDYAMNIIRLKEREYCRIKDEGDQELDGQDLLSRFMSSTSNFGFHGQDERRKFLRDIVISFILAGKDSTSTALTWFFWVIAGHPRCERMIYDELLAAVAASPADSPKSFSYDELKKLHYLHAALSETLRLFPPVPIDSRLAVAEDVLVDGTYVGKGWFADYSAYAMGRMEKLWGPDCKEFKPERWLDDGGEVFQPSDQFKFPVFHGGPRLCLGKEMAYVQMKTVAAAVIYEFEIEAVDGSGSAERMIDPPYTLSLLLKMKGGLPVRLKRRPRPSNSHTVGLTST
ncbi:cytochrome P450 94A1-like [Actinidia eriantha]|uniref:cytochrome P450 94A1-like n=1 Tax=Actinidia eriantha TaxID=165200 RepID=UPI0025911295|nr:cytochrome P450 94A1-like [Actinidia eriantha]